MFIHKSYRKDLILDIDYNPTNGLLYQINLQFTQFHKKQMHDQKHRFMYISTCGINVVKFY